ncbi:hypothetical protein [Tatumella sp. UCD-D_suzukii]|uniref:hypothetical protein n=1 Tax=Tatumella sp. UCD-D_suzukii TaxID=1408192 RepID=UPI000470CD87|nr:hypothetical protein [Tatumella sp. UCD-D_suzukii]
MNMKSEEYFATLAQGVVDAMYSDGKSPLHAFGTTWEKISKLEGDNPSIHHDNHDVERLRK